jgi:hypothetical protein
MLGTLCLLDAASIAEPAVEGSESKEEKARDPPKERGGDGLVAVPQKHIVLDVDETLVAGLAARPGLRSFLAFLFGDPRIATVSVWTASTGWWQEVYPQAIEPLMPAGKQFHLVWEGTRCGHCYNPDEQDTCRTKPLKKMWRLSKKTMNRRNTLILDDTAFAACKNRGNFIRIQPFFALSDREDTELARVRALLDSVLLMKQDVRARTH